MVQRPAPPPLHTPRPGAGPAGHGLREASPLEPERRAVVRGEARGHPARPHEPAVGRAPLLLPVVMGAVAPGEESEAAQRLQFPRDHGVAEPLLEPAHGAGADPGQDDPLPPCLAEDPVDPPLPPQQEHVARLPAPHVDHVLPQHEGPEAPRRRREEGEVRRAAAEPPEGPVEPRGVERRVPARRAHEADPGPPPPGQGEHVLVQQRVPRLHREPSAPHGEDRAAARHALRTPCFLPTLVKAATARSIMASSWSAESWTRMRSWPFGTTGYVKATT